MKLRLIFRYDLGIQMGYKDVVDYCTQVINIDDSTLKVNYHTDGKDDSYYPQVIGGEWIREE